MKTSELVKNLLRQGSPADPAAAYLMKEAASRLVRLSIPAEDDPRQKLLTYVMRRLEDDMETSDLCVNLVHTMINAMNWSPETEKLVIEAMKPVAAEMHKLAVEYHEILGMHDPEA